MQQITQSYRTGQFELSDVPMPLCRDNGVLVRTKISLVSAGTEKGVIDLAKKSLAAKAKSRPDLVRQVAEKIKQEGVLSTLNKVLTKLDNPVLLGYSCSGEVIQAGKNTPDFKPGDRVACGGSGYACHAQVNFVPKNLCVKIPDQMSYDEAAFTTLGAIAMQGVRRCELKPGEKVAVIGLGLIGQLTARILSAYGSPVLGLDIDERKIQRILDVSLAKGAVIGRDNIEDLALSMTQGYGFDAVIITASTTSNDPVTLAGKICRQAGRISVVGMVGMDIPRDIYYEKELDFRLSCSYGPGRYDKDYEERGQDYPFAYVRWTEKRNMEEFLRLVDAGRVDVKSLITHSFPVEQYEKAYGLLEQASEDYVGILLQYGDACRDQRPAVILRNEPAKNDPKGLAVAGLIGCGSFAQGVLLPHLIKIPKVKIKAVADRVGKNAENTAKKYHCDYCTTDYQEILADNKINSIFITTRHNEHAPMVLAALEKNKHVFVEKPLCLKEEELKDISSLYHKLEEQGKRPFLMVGFNRRFAPAAVQAKEKLSRRTTPLMINYRVNAGFIPLKHWVHDPQEGGGRILGEVCHFVDLLQFLTGAVPTRVYASALPSDGKVLSHDNVSAVIDFSDGSRGSILYTAMGDKSLGKEYIEIFGDGRSLVIDDFKSGKWVLSQDKGHVGELRSFVESVCRGSVSPISFEEIKSATWTTLKIIQSLKTGEFAKIDMNDIP